MQSFGRYRFDVNTILISFTVYGNPMFILNLFFNDHDVDGLKNKKPVACSYT